MDNTPTLIPRLRGALHRFQNRVVNWSNTVLYAAQIVTLLHAQQDGDEETWTDTICRRLLENEMLCFQIGWFEDDYFSGEELDRIHRALQLNESLTHIRIGWRLRPSNLMRILEGVACMNSPVQYLSLVLHAHVPQYVLEAIVERHGPHLIEVDIRNVKLRRGTPVRQLWCGGRPPPFFAPMEGLVQDYPVTDIVSTILEHPDHDRIRMLKLIDCDLQHEEIDILCEVLKRPTCCTSNGPLLESLSLGCNTNIPPRDLKRLLQLNISHLDLSGCELSPMAGRAIAQALIEMGKSCSSTFPLKSLNLERNPFLKTSGIEILKAAGGILRSLDLSYTNLDITAVLTAISPIGGTLRELILQGYVTHLYREADIEDEDQSAAAAAGEDFSEFWWVSASAFQQLPPPTANSVPLGLLQDFLSSNQSLTTLILNDPKSRTPIPWSLWTEARAGLASNYRLQRLELEWGDLNRGDIDMYLRLNKAGRQILRSLHENHGDETLSQQPAPAVPMPVLTKSMSQPTSFCCSDGGSVLATKACKPWKSSRSFLDHVDNHTGPMRPIQGTITKRKDSRLLPYGINSFVAVLGSASGDVDSLYWLISNGAAFFKAGGSSCD